MKVTNPKILFSVIGLLVILNISLIAFFYFSPTLGPRRPPRAASEFLIQELQLNSDQVLAYKNLIEGHRKKADSLVSIIRTLKTDYFSKIGSGEQNDTLVLRIGEQQLALEKLTFNHFQYLFELCDLEQKKKFKGVIHEAMKQMSPERPPHEGRPGRERQIN